MAKPSKRTKRMGLAAAGGVAALIVILKLTAPGALFDDPLSPVLFSQEGRLLGARTAVDGQWRFPQGEDVPARFFRVLLQYEDRRFFWHPGVDPAAVVRSAALNLRAGRVRSGASTITMQVVRLSRKNPRRTYFEKMKEAALAFRVELSRSKKEILALFTAHAPFGGNVVGIDAASWMYFGRSPRELSWAEAAYLAVLPKDPGLIASPEGRMRILEKRNALLDRLKRRNIISDLEYRLALTESIPEAFRPVPREAPHLLDSLAARRDIRTPYHSLLKADLQRTLARITREQGDRLFHIGIRNLAAVIIDNSTADVVAYIGNVGLDREGDCGQHVDILLSPRSTGSILKPFLYAAMIQEGGITPLTLVPDTPVRFENFRPENFDRRFRGAVPARAALAWSLNVPAVRMLREFGIPRMTNRLRQWGMTTLTRSPEHYGLTLVLGGAEGRLLEIAALYAGLARTAMEFEDGSLELRLLRDDTPVPSRLSELGPGAAYLTLEALTAVNRPDEEGFWRNFSSAKWAAWKTGTSFGLRDAWAVGVTPRYTVGIWAGNADGEGKPGLTGLSAAAPVLFDVLHALDTGGRINRPRRGLKPIQVCRDSGFLASPLCPSETVWVPEESRFNRVCVYHQRIHLDASGRFRVDSRCESVDRMRPESWFILPPVQEFYYRKDHPEYRLLPPFRADCGSPLDAGRQVMNLVYPDPDTSVYIPVDIDGRRGEVVFEAVHSEVDAVIHWHIDDMYVTSTQRFHQIAVDPDPGDRVLILVDGQGRRLVRPFKVISPARKELRP
ncbi:MAG: penicillin-binding protein 1C [Acidobacteriota bacterium]|nr:penicillin-binding protein 1C [Acidobacteriota bacterium]